MDLAAFVQRRLPRPPARVLEVGCGKGELALALDAAGWDVTAIDPAAPEGPIFRRLKLEDLADETFDAVVASSSLHHVGDLVLALDRILALLEPGGVLVLDEFGWDLLDAPTARWYRQQRGDGGSLDDYVREWEADHVGLHGYADMRAELDRRFVERYFAWTPYLYRLLGGEAAAGLERRLIERGEVRPIGFRYVGTPAGGSDV